MLSDKQSLILCALVVIGFALGGILDILNNYVITSLLILAFLAIVINLFYLSNHSEKDDDEDSIES